MCNSNCWAVTFMIDPLINKRFLKIETIINKICWHTTGSMRAEVMWNFAEIITNASLCLHFLFLRIICVITRKFLHMSKNVSIYLSLNDSIRICKAFVNINWILLYYRNYLMIAISTDISISLIDNFLWIGMSEFIPNRWPFAVSIPSTFNLISWRSNAK